MKQKNRRQERESEEDLMGVGVSRRMERSSSNEGCEVRTCHGNSETVSKAAAK